jgi:hypothetical protein
VNAEVDVAAELVAETMLERQLDEYVLLADEPGARRPLRTEFGLTFRSDEAYE